MTPQEQQLLKGLTDRVNQTVLADKDPEAEQFINQALGRNPDATYILAQTVLVQQYALESAKKQLDQMKQQQAQQPAPQPHHTSFLGGLLGLDDKPAPPPPPAQQGYQPVRYAPAAPPQQTVQYVQAQPVGIFGSPMGGGMFGGGSSFLGGAMQTAAGVAAGALAFEGIEDLMHGFDHHAGYGSGFGGFDQGTSQPRDEVINNNYYGDQNSGTAGDHSLGGDFADRLGTADGASGTSSDIEDRRGFADTGDQNDVSDQFADTSSTDDSSNFDDSSFASDFNSSDDSGDYSS